MPSPKPSLDFPITATQHAHIYHLYSALSVIDRSFFLGLGVCWFESQGFGLQWSFLIWFSSGS